ncbi:protein transport protein Sec61 subunit beta-like [Dysidea avara]|uniref:protein transport protein Sec61 subunit beta-like n=1 Tax=Dysidea avara TaxID=196820 RepID=UPI00332551E5
MRSPSSTSVGAGRSGGSSKPARSSAGGVRQRKSGGSTARTTSTAGGVSSGGGTMWRFYTGDDSPGIKIGPVPVLVMSLLFIASVFLLHIWGKYSRR